MNLIKWLFYIGIGFIVIALIAYLFSRWGITLGKLPGDIKSEKYRVYFPIVSSIVISVILTVVVNLIVYLFRK